MASIKITELTEKTEVGINDVLPIVDTTTNETKKITGANLLNSQYSTNEIKTNMKWIDGKDIYRKVISISEMPLYDSNYPQDENFTRQYDTNITGLENLIKIDGCYYSLYTQTPSATMPLNWIKMPVASTSYTIDGTTFSVINPAQWINTRLNQDGTKITIDCSEFFVPNIPGGFDRQYCGYIILEYTKTS